MEEKYKDAFARIPETAPDVGEEIFRGVVTVGTHNCQNEEEVASARKIRVLKIHRFFWYTLPLRCRFYNFYEVKAR